jgi:hypothetical protein
MAEGAKALRSAGFLAGPEEAGALAQEGSQSIVPAAVTVESQEATGQDAAAQQRAKLLLDETRRRAA